MVSRRRQPGIHGGGGGDTLPVTRGGHGRVVTTVRAAAEDFFRRQLGRWPLFADRKHFRLIATLLLIAEVAISWFIVHHRKYTEIDWSTYMQQVECFLGGTLDYEAIKGDTGPIVYPAGHLYLYTLLYFITGRGANIYLGQCIFALLYLLLMGLVFSLYAEKSSQVPPYVLIFMVFSSHRVHSLFMLRLFNDPVAMLFLYGALVAFTRRHWTTGSVLFSLAVSIKMNVLLFAPALFLLLVESHPGRRLLTGVLKNLAVCAAVQLLLGLPFLATHPLAYLRSAFNLGRVFLHQWTVNYRFLPEALFTSPVFHLSLLAVHIAALVLFFWPRWTSTAKRLLLSCTGRDSTATEQQQQRSSSVTPSSQNILLTMFTANLIGVACSRSLHYQFYVWYYHSLPALLWATRFTPLTNICIWGLVELCWNVYPSTAWSSALLHCMHLLLLLGLFVNRSANGLATGRTMTTAEEANDSSSSSKAK